MICGNNWLSAKDVGDYVPSYKKKKGRNNVSSSSIAQQNSIRNIVT